METIGIVAGVVAVVVLVLYVWDRKTKQQPIDLMDAVKFMFGASGIAGGVAYAVAGTEEAIEAAAVVPEVVQEMFVGKPEF